MKKKIIIAAVLVIIALIALYLFVQNGSENNLQANAASSINGKGEILYYRSPMNPNQISEVPMKDEMGMDYVPVYNSDLNKSGIVKIDPAVVQNMNVKTSVVQARELPSRIVTNGILETNKTQNYIVTTRIGGYVQKLYVSYEGQKVQKGEKLMDIYSPELLAAQQELLTALSYNHGSGNTLVKNAVRKLHLLGITDSQIDKFKSGGINTLVTLFAENTGTVISKNITEGQKITAGESLMKISNLSTLWLIADIYEYELSKVKVGSKAAITFNLFPGKEFTGKVSFIYPTIDPETRTASIRIDLHNPNGLLKPNMFAKVEIKSKGTGKYPVIPEQSVLRSGGRNTVILSIGEGKFKPAKVELGNYSEGYYQVLNGISEGDKIVISGQFLIGSESNLQTALSQFTEEEYDTLLDKSSSTEMEMNNQLDTANSQSANQIIRKGIIDLDAIDENKDGKLFQDIMDWNVISDEPGTCPICGMTLKEFPIKEVKKNLTENGFNYK